MSTNVEVLSATVSWLGVDVIDDLLDHLLLPEPDYWMFADPWLKLAEDYAEHGEFFEASCFCG